MICLYVLVFCTLTALRHYNFQTQAWDMGIFEQSFWNAANGRGLINTIEQLPRHLGIHFSPFLFLLVPGFMFFHSPYYLLIIQTLALVLGAWPLFLLAKKILGEPVNPMNGAGGQKTASWWALAIVAAYLLYPSLHAIQMFDFHEVAFFVPLLLGAIYFMETEKWLWAGLLGALAATVKEDVILAVLFVGIFLLFKTARPENKNTDNKDRNKKIAVAVIICSALIYFVLVVKVFMPAAGGGVLRIDRYSHLGETAVAMVQNAMVHPLLLVKTVFTLPKMFYAFWLFLPLLFLPFLSWRPFILLIPGLAENLLTNYWPQYNSLYHYDAILIPGMLVATIYGVKTVVERWPNKERPLRFLFMATILAGVLLHSPVRPTAFPVSYFQTTPQETAYRNLVKLVPNDVSVATHTNLVPHLANREKVYFAGLETKRTDIVLLDAGNLFGFGSDEAFTNYVESYRASGEYNLYSFDERYFVLLNKKLRLSGLPAKPQQENP